VVSRFSLENYVLDCCWFSGIEVSHGRVATHFRCGGTFNFFTNLLLSLLVKKNANRSANGEVTGSSIVALF